MPVFSADVPANVSLTTNITVGTVTVAITATGDADLTYALTSQTPNSTPKIFAIAASSGLLTIYSLPGPIVKSYSLLITYVDMVWFKFSLRHKIGQRKRFLIMTLFIVE